jgi:hypothetical protein
MVKPKAKQNKHVEINRRQKKIITLKLVQCMARFWTHLFDEGKCYENEKE